MQSSPLDRDRNDGTRDFASKVPAVTIAFWIIKICATTVGETGGDALSMTLKLGYALSTLIFLSIFLVTVSAQIASRRFHPFIYWAVVVATTTVGTTMSDFLDRTAGLGYVYSSIIEFVGVLAVLFIWRQTTGRIEFENIQTRTEEIFYWLTILVSNTLGTAVLGDMVADDLGLGFQRGHLLFTGLIVLVAAAYFFTKIPAQHSVLVGLRPHATAWRHTRRHADQTQRRRRLGPEPHHVLVGPRGGDGRADPAELAKVKVKVAPVAANADF